MTTTLFEIEVNEFCDGFPVINGEVAQKLSNTFKHSYGNSLLMSLFISTVVMEELRLTDMEEDMGEELRALAIKAKSVQYSEVPVKFTYSFGGKPVLTEDFLRKFSEFFNHGHTPEISELLSRLQDTYKGVVLRRFSDKQLDYISELLLMVHDAVYSMNRRDFWNQDIAKHVSDGMISEVFDQQFLSVVKAFESDVPESEKKSDLIFMDGQFLMKTIVEFLALVRKRSSGLNPANIWFYNLLSMHDSTVIFVRDFQKALEFDDYEYDVIGSIVMTGGTHRGLEDSVFDMDSCNDNTFRYKLSKFDNIHGTPFMTVDFLTYMYKFFGGGHSAELRKVLQQGLVDAMRFETGPSVKRTPMLSKPPVHFTYSFYNIREDGSKHHMDKDFLYHLNRFFNGGNTAASSGFLYSLRNFVR